MQAITETNLNGDGPLSDIETTQLASLEMRVEANIKGFVAAGEALKAIRDRRLYRDGHATFEAYLANRWNLDRRYAYRLIDAAEVVERVAHGPHVPAPESERAARALAAVPEDEQAGIWAEAVEAAGGVAATGAQVERAIAARRAEAMPGPLSDEDAAARALLDSLGPNKARRAASGEPDGVTPHLFGGEPLAAAIEDKAPEKARTGGGTSDEYFTRAEHVAAARRVMDGIELDPASCEAAQTVILAARHYTKDDDGLAQPWMSRAVYCNPPYSNVGGWVERLVNEHLAGNVDEAILLVNASTSSAWFEALWEHSEALCFVRGRVSFDTVNEAGERVETGSGRSSSVFAYFGDRPRAFALEFEKFGRIVSAWPDWGGPG